MKKHVVGALLPELRKQQAELPAEKRTENRYGSP
jgi:hypothetical protein